MFAFLNSNPSWVQIYIPKKVREQAGAYAMQHRQPIPYPNYAGRVYEYSQILLDCVAGWAMSKWCVENNIWHDPNLLDENNADLLLDFNDVGICAINIAARFMQGPPAANEGIRISHYRLSTEGVQNYIVAGFNGSHVTFYGGVMANNILGSDFVYEIRPLIYDYPADELPFTMAFIKENTRAARDSQEIFYNLFDEGDE